MPWQLSGNGRSGWSTKLIRGLKAEAAAGFQSRRERCRESTPVTPQYAAFSTYKAGRVSGSSNEHLHAWCDLKPGVIAIVFEQPRGLIAIWQLPRCGAIRPSAGGQ